MLFPLVLEATNPPKSTRITKRRAGGNKMARSRRRTSRRRVRRAAVRTVRRARRVAVNTYRRVRRRARRAGRAVAVAYRRRRRAGGKILGGFRGLIGGDMPMIVTGTLLGMTVPQVLVRLSGIKGIQAFNPDTGEPQGMANNLAVAGTGVALGWMVGKVLKSRALAVACIASSIAMPIAAWLGTQLNGWASKIIYGRNPATSGGSTMSGGATGDTGTAGYIDASSGGGVQGYVDASVAMMAA